MTKTNNHQKQNTRMYDNVKHDGHPPVYTKTSQHQACMSMSISGPCFDAKKCKITVIAAPSGM